MAESFEWYYMVNEDRVGPVSFQVITDLIVSRRLAPESYVWRSGFEDWKQVLEVESLSSFLPQSEPRITLKAATEPEADASKAPAKDGVKEERLNSVHDYLAYANQKKKPEAARVKEGSREVKLDYATERSTEYKLWIVFLVFGVLGAVAAYFYQENIAEFVSAFSRSAGSDLKLSENAFAWWGLVYAAAYSVVPVGILCLCRYFQCGIWWGLGSIFVPFVALICIILHWDHLKRMVGLTLGISLIKLMCLGFILYPAVVHASDF